MRPADPRLRPLRLLLAIVALATAAALPAQAQDGGTPATVLLQTRAVDGKVDRTLDFAEKLASAGDVETVLARLPDGEQIRIARGITVGAFLRAANVEPGSYGSVVATDAVGPVEVSARQAFLSGRGGNVGQAAILYVADGQLRLLRQQLQGETTPPQLAVADASNVLALALRRPAGWSFEGLRRATPGQQVEVRFIPAEGMDLSGATFRWEFGDLTPGQTTTTPRVTHAFRETGTFQITLEAQRGGQRIDLGTPIPTHTVEVDDGDDGDAPDRRAVSSASRARATTGNEEASEPDTAPTPQTPAGGGPALGGGVPGASVSPTPGAVTPPASTPPPAAEPDPPPRRAAATPPAPAGETVTGYLLASTSGAPVTRAAATPQSAAIEPAEAADGGLDVPPIAWVLIGLAGLVVLGWALESRTTLPYFKP